MKSDVHVKFIIEAGALHMYLHNRGRSLAEHVRCFIEIPEEFLKDSGEKKIHKSNAPYLSYYQFDLNNRNLGVVHAGLTLLIKSESINDSIIKDLKGINRKEKLFYWKVYADNNAVVEGETTLNEIEFTESV